MKSGYDISREIRNIAHDWYSIIILCSIYPQKENFISSKLAITKYLSKYDDFDNNIKKTLKEAINILNKKILEPTQYFFIIYLLK